MNSAKILGQLSRIGTLLLAVGAVATPAKAQDFDPGRIVFPITDFKPDILRASLISIKFGPGFCLDPNCRFVGTNYHVAKEMGRYVRIKGVFSAHRYLDSASDDAGARDVEMAMGGTMKFTLAHDLAIYEMRHPLKQYHGVGFEADEPDSNTEVDIYGYPFKGNPKRGLVQWHGKYIGKIREGLLAFSYDEGRVRGGTSGGIVVDSKSKKIVGVLNSFNLGKDRIVFAVPVKELADFVAHAQPYLQAALFPKTVFISPVAPDFYRPYDWPPNEARTFEVARLRFLAQDLADSMQNFIATQTFAWGHDSNEPEYTDAYETQILNGAQRWRRSSGKKYRDQISFPSMAGWVAPGPEWSLMPEMVGTEVRLKMHQAPDATVAGRTVHIFQYAAKAEENACGLQTWMVFWSKTKSYDCHGEVWVDESWNILRISEAMDLSGPWYRLWEVVTYGWVEKDGKRYPVPVTISTQAERGKTYWCRGLFTDYNLLRVKSRVIAVNN